MVLHPEDRGVIEQNPGTHAQGEYQFRLMGYRLPWLQSQRLDLRRRGSIRVPRPLSTAWTVAVHGVVSDLATALCAIDNSLK